MSKIPSHDLSLCTWDQIGAASKAKFAEKWWPLGSLSPLVHIEGQPVGIDLNFNARFRILDFNHNAELEGDCTTSFWLDQNEEGIPIAIDDPQHYRTEIDSNVTGLCMNRKGQLGVDEPDPTMSSGAKGYGTNTGGWRLCYGRIAFCSEFFDCLPSDVRSVIVPSRIYTDNVANETVRPANVSATDDLIYFLSLFEVFGDSSKVRVPYEKLYQTQMEWFRLGNYTAAKRLSEPAVNAEVHSRSPVTDSDNMFHEFASNLWYSWAGAAYSMAARPALKV